jgi:hypothetical protein
MDFDKWLYSQRYRQGAIGDLVRYIDKDPYIMKGDLQTGEALMRYLSRTSPDRDMEYCARNAWKEFCEIPPAMRNPVDQDGNLLMFERLRQSQLSCWKCHTIRYTDIVHCPKCGATEVEGLNHKWRTAMVYVVYGFFVLLIIAMFGGVFK